MMLRFYQVYLCFRYILLLCDHSLATIKVTRHLAYKNDDYQAPTLD